MSRRQAVAIVTAVLLLAAAPADARRTKWTDMPEALVDIARQHQRSLEASIPKRERDVRESSASLDRNTALYARGVITREELAVAAREAGEARAQLAWARAEIQRAHALIAEIEARRRLASLPPLRPGQYEAVNGLIRFSGHRGFSPAHLPPLERFFTVRVGRPLPVSAHGQSDVHTRLGLDHRNAVDLALHPDSDEGRLVMGWLREQGFPFMAFRGARHGAATGAHIHVGAPSERLTIASARGLAPPRRSPAAAAVAARSDARPALAVAPASGAPPPPAAGLRDDPTRTARSDADVAAGTSPRGAGARAVTTPAPTTQVLTR